MTEEVAAPTTEQPQETSSQKVVRYFGQNYVGEVTEAAPLAASVEEIVEVSEIEASEEILETVESATTDLTEYQEYELGQIAQLLGVDEDQLDVNEEGRIVLSGKVDGESVKTNAKDLLANYQMLQAADKRLDDAKTKAKAQTQELAEKSEALKARFATVAKLIENAESFLEKDFKSVEWDRLRKQDPAEYAAKKRDFDDRKNEINSIKVKAGEEYNQYSAGQSEEAQRQHQAYLAQENQKLMEALPEWSDTEKAKTEKSKLAEYLMNQGFTKDDVMAASDHRLIVLARKAMLFDSTAATSNAALKKVARVPKVTKPGATKSAEQITKQRLDKHKERLQGTGSFEDGLALLKARRSK